MSIAEHTYDLSLESHSVQQLNSHLSESLKLRITNIPLPPACKNDGEDKVRMAILFSGGLDCTVLARLAHDILPSDQCIDLINVAFENPRVIQAAKSASSSKKGNKSHEAKDEGLEENESSAYEKCPDRETGRKAFQELQQICPGRSWRFVAVNVLIVHSKYILADQYIRLIYHIRRLWHTALKSYSSSTLTTPKWTYPSPTPSTSPHVAQVKQPPATPPPQFPTPHQLVFSYPA